MTRSLVELNEELVKIEPNRLVRLPAGDRFIGLLRNVLEPDGEDFVLAKIDGSLVRVPSELASQLQALVDQRIVVGNIPLTGWRVGKATDPKPTFQRILAELLGEEPQPEQAKPRPQPHKAPVLAAVEEIRANLPNKRVETDYNGDFPAILVCLQAGPRRTVQIAMQCNLSDEAARRRLKILVDSGTVEHEKITRIVNKRSYEFDTKRWQLVKNKIGEICNDCEGKIAAK